ncbi:condensation domain-containing protein [Saccharomonospora sp. NPDC046836]|uniref:condensation domain-containing protein n=1 Tax=Saccharomonospora sp. NPDC046836 TaxID=3156921 RepID=UPI0033C8E45B
MQRFPATSRQRWYFRAHHDGQSTLNVPVAIQLGSCDEHAVSEAIHGLVSRHDALRTTLTRSGTGVVQQVSTTAEEVSLDVADVGDISPDELQKLVLAILDEPFHVHDGSLFRSRLLRLGASRSVLVLSVHHAICDGWSAGIIFRDFAELYRSARDTRGPVLPRLDLQLPDYATWEWKLATEDPPYYWPHLLSSQNPRFPLGSREAADTGAGVFQSFPLPTVSVQTGAELGRLAVECRTTPARVVTAAVAASLAPVVGPRLTVGVFVGNRDQPELLNVVGDLADRLPVVVDTAGNPSFGELIGRVDDGIAAALDHYAPMAALAPLIRANPERRAGPLVDVTVNYLPHRTQLNRAPDGTVADSVTELEPELEHRSFRVDQWREGFGIVDYQHRPRPDGTIGGYLLANINVLTPEQAHALGSMTNETLVRLVTEPGRRVADLARPAFDRSMLGKKIDYE